MFIFARSSFTFALPFSPHVCILEAEYPVLSRASMRVECLMRVNLRSL